MQVQKQTQPIVESEEFLLPLTEDEQDCIQGGLGNTSAGRIASANRNMNRHLIRMVEWARNAAKNQNKSGQRLKGF